MMVAGSSREPRRGRSAPSRRGGRPSFEDSRRGGPSSRRGGRPSLENDRRSRGGPSSRRGGRPSPENSRRSRGGPSSRRGGRPWLDDGRRGAPPPGPLDEPPPGRSLRESERLLLGRAISGLIFLRLRSSKTADLRHLKTGFQLHHLELVCRLFTPCL